MEQEVLLKIENVVKTYPGVQALKGITTTIKKGEVRALVGENGAGKSTTTKMLTGILYPSSGDVSVMGINPVKERKRLSAADIAANKNTYYGAVAQNYTKGGLTYRIFYVDTENKFI